MTLNSTSDLPIAASADILVRAVELRADAMVRGDAPTVKALDRVIVALTCGASCWWQDGVLCVTSVNSPGAIYALSCGVCSCPARKPCWHMQLLDIVLDMQDTAAGDADFEADADDLAALATADDTDDDAGGESGTTPVAPAPFVLSAYAVKRFVLGPMLRRTAARLAVMRADQRLAINPPAIEPQIAAPLGQRLTAARRTHPAYTRPLFAQRDAETARRQAKGEMRAQLEQVQARRQAARAATA